MNSATEELSSKQQKKKAAPKKIRFQRIFTKEGMDVFSTVDWVIKDTVLRGADGGVVFQQTGVEVPAYWNDTTVNVVVEKYFRMVNGVREKSAKQMFHRVAFWMTSQAVSQGILDSHDADGRTQHLGTGILGGADAKIFYDELLFMLLHGMFAFNSPVWFNVGVVEKPQCSACFIQSVQDEMHDIMDLAKKEVMLFKQGSGTGSDLSPLRSSWEIISGGGQASGPVSFMEMFDAGAGVTKSGGTTRRAAKMVTLRITHPDIYEQRNGKPGFITCKSDAEQMAHDLYSTGKYSAEFNKPGNVYDYVKFQNANNSVRVTDEFMRAVERDEDWAVKEVTSGKIVKTYSARFLWKEIAKAAWKCGDPGIQFDTATNEWHTVPNAGRINASNPCSEYLFLDDTACNLASLNLRKFVKDGRFDVKAFEHACEIGITAMEAAVEGSSYPSEEIERNSHTYRTLGLGYTNMGALLTFFGLPYDSNDGRSLAGAITAVMGGAAQRQSARLAEIRGPFAAYENNREAMLNVIDKHVNAAKRIPFPIQKQHHAVIERASEVWMEAREEGRLCGFRNAQVTVLAPTGTISFLMMASTTGVEPETALVKFKKLVGGGQAIIVNEDVEPALLNLGYKAPEIAAILEYVREKRTIHGAPGFDDDKHGAVFCESLGKYALRSEAHILMMSAVQPFLSGGISKTVNLPKEATPEDIEKIYMLAWKEGLKCVAVYRNECKLSQPISTDGVILKGASKTLQWGERKKMPDDRPARAMKFTIAGTEIYVHVGLWDDGQPGEIFLRISKMGSTMGGLADWAATATSFAFQYGAPLGAMAEKFIDQEFEPKGYTNHPVLRRAKSIPDLIFQWLVLEYAPGSRHILRLRDMEVPVTELPMQTMGEVRAIVENEGSHKIGLFDGPPCGRCGSITKRTGACYTCSGCGTSSGCG